MSASRLRAKSTLPRRSPLEHLGGRWSLARLAEPDDQPVEIRYVLASNEDFGAA